MANAAAKRLAIENKKILARLHFTSIIVILIQILGHAFLQRPKSLVGFLTFSAPAWAIQMFYFEPKGRPKYTESFPKVLLSPGKDLSAPDITEYLWDIIYITWICSVLVVITGTTKIWWLYSIIPLYAVYKAFSLLSLLRGNFANNANNNGENTPQYSKRQSKLQKRVVH